MQGQASGMERLGADRAQAQLDFAGVALVGLSILWVCVAAAGRSARIMPMVLLLVAAVAAYVVGRVVGVPHDVTLPATIACGLALVLAVSSSAGSVSPPLGYGNANGALGVQGIVAAMMAAVASRHPPTRRGLYALGAVLLLETALTRSLAATLLGVLVLGVGLVAPVLRGRRLLAVGGLVIVAGCAVATTVIGLRYEPQHRSPETVVVAQDVLSSRRVQLWHEAVSMVSDDPVRGVGPGRFSVESPTAQEDPDARWAHSAPLQLAAEQGLPGAGLLAALMVWAFVSLVRSPRSDPVVVCALAGVIAFGVQACIDYIAYFPAIPLALALLLGVATAPMSSGVLPQSRRLRS
jgi:O-antigen ligase